MKVLIAPDSFKGSLSSIEVCAAMHQGVKQSRLGAEVMDCPVCDGGEGTLETLVNARDGRMENLEVMGPLGAPVKAQLGWWDDQQVAIVEMAQAAGLHHVPQLIRDAGKTTTYGVGELMAHAIRNGAKKLILGIGGSATTDGGIGMAQALGVQFKGIRETGACGDDLSAIASIDASDLIFDPNEIEILVASDVTNPLYGSLGAAHVYGPQKGATPYQVKMLDQGLKHLSMIVERDLDRDFSKIAGAGAAGGLGYGLLSFCGAGIGSGIELILDVIDFDNKLKEADLVITGEGCFDGQSKHGKTCYGVAMRAHEKRVPVIVIAGTLGEDYESSMQGGVTAAFGIAQGPMSLRESMLQTRELLVAQTANVMRCVGVGQFMGGHWGASACGG